MGQSKAGTAVRFKQPTKEFEDAIAANHTGEQYDPKHTGKHRVPYLLASEGHKGDLPVLIVEHRRRSNDSGPGVST